MRNLLLSLALFTQFASSAGACKVTCMSYDYPDGKKGYLWLDMGPLGACPDSEVCKQPTYQTDDNDFCTAEQVGQKIEGICVPFIDSH